MGFKSIFQRWKYPILITASIILTLTATFKINLVPEPRWVGGLISVLPFWFWAGIGLYLYTFIDFLSKINDKSKDKKTILSVISMMLLFVVLFNLPMLYSSQRMWVPDAYIWMASSLTIVDTYHTGLVTYDGGRYSPAFILPVAISSISGLSLYQIYSFVLLFTGFIFSVIWFFFLLDVTNSVRVSALASGLMLKIYLHWSPATLGEWIMFLILFTYFRGLKCNDKRFILISYFSLPTLIFTHPFSPFLLASILTGMYVGTQFVFISNRFLSENYRIPYLNRLKPDIKFIILVWALFGVFNIYTGMLTIISESIKVIWLLIGTSVTFLAYLLYKKYLRRSIKNISSNWILRINAFLDKSIKKIITKKGIAILSFLILLPIIFSALIPMSEQAKRLGDILVANNPLTLEGVPSIYLSSYLYGNLVLFILAIVGIWVGLKKKHKFVPAVLGWAAIFYIHLIISIFVLRGVFLQPLRVIYSGIAPMRIFAGVSYSYFLFDNKKIQAKMLVALILASTLIATFFVGHYRMQGSLYYDSIYTANTWVMLYVQKDDRVYMSKDVSSWMRYEYLLKYRDNDPRRLNLLNYVRIESMALFSIDKKEAMGEIYLNKIDYLYIYPQNMWNRMETLYILRNKSVEYKKQVLNKFDELPLSKIYTNGATANIFSVL